MSQIRECPGVEKPCGTVIRADEELCGFCRQEHGGSAAKPREVTEGAASRGPATRMLTCKRCEQPFEHTFPRGLGRAPSYCSGCKSQKPAPSPDRRTKRGAGLRVAVNRKTLQVSLAKATSAVSSAVKSVVAKKAREHAKGPLVPARHQRAGVQATSIPLRCAAADESGWFDLTLAAITRDFDTLERDVDQLVARSQAQ